jgi:two-component system LytT family response regulator
MSGVDTSKSLANKNLRAIIVDDEELARQLLREYLWDAGGVEIVAECGDGFDAVKAITELKPKLDGFVVLEIIGPFSDAAPPSVIFVTAYDQYAMRAFEANAIDYLLKPFRLDRFKKALDRAKERVQIRPGVNDAIPAGPTPNELAAAARPPGQPIERLVVRDGSKVPVAKLDYVEAQDDYAALHSEQKSYLKQQTIASLEAQLDPQRFVRIHRSYIVNLERIARIEPYAKDSRIVVLRDGAQLPVSRSGFVKLKEILGENV